MSEELFSLGSVVIPAVDGTLSDLGVDLTKTQSAALGVVIETRSSKSLVCFPGLKLTLWLDHDELTLAAQFSQLKADQNPVWILESLAQIFEIHSVLSIEGGKLSDVWDEGLDTLSDYYQGSSEVNCWYFGLALHELKLSEWDRAKVALGERLLFARFLPAGMHKLELALYLKS